MLELVLCVSFSQPLSLNVCHVSARQVTAVILGSIKKLPKDISFLGSGGAGAENCLSDPRAHALSVT